MAAGHAAAAQGAGAQAQRVLRRRARPPARDGDARRIAQGQAQQLREPRRAAAASRLGREQDRRRPHLLLEHGHAGGVVGAPRGRAARRRHRRGIDAVGAATHAGEPRRGVGGQSLALDHALPDRLQAGGGGARPHGQARQPRRPHHRAPLRDRRRREALRQDQGGAAQLGRRVQGALAEVRQGGDRRRLLRSADDRGRTQGAVREALVD
mmetsp:Transcript_35221/g.97424  ORF Transcript_35221/g.97424 Transcript_35221/m.97424 type:complete len:210 (-) Transcript_35221:324-953(-)